jgi:hypothetical protein
MRAEKAMEKRGVYCHVKRGGADWLKKLFAHGIKFYILLPYILNKRLPSRTGNFFKKE